MNNNDIKLGRPTLCKMNAEIEANKAAIAELLNPTPPEIPDMTMNRDKLVELAGDIDTEGMSKAEIITAIALAREPE